ncbi:MAG: hypothetical protein AAFQ35_05640 [Pseudomonadota bacterium]
MNERDLLAIARDSQRVRAVAQRTRAQLGRKATDFEVRFLDRLSAFNDPYGLAVRDREILAGLLAKVSRRREKGGYRAATLIEKCWRNRHDLPEEDEVFLTDLMTEGRACAPTENQWRKLFAVARRLGEIDHFVA